MAIDPTQVRRFAHGSRVPGWDEAADLSKDPGFDLSIAAACMICPLWQYPH